jgi:large subunit ribosomal protein L35
MSRKAFKPNKGLLKRIKITAGGKVKWRKPSKGHLNSHMSGKKLRQLNRKGMASRADIGRLSAMLGRPLSRAGAD